MTTKKEREKLQTSLHPFNLSLSTKYVCTKLSKKSFGFQSFGEFRILRSELVDLSFPHTVIFRLTGR